MTTSRRGRHLLACGTAALALPVAAAAQTTSASTEAQPGAPTEAQQDASETADGEIVVSARRTAGSVIGDVQPVAVLDAAAMHAMGATSLKELLQRVQGLTTSANGSPPVFLLNGRRVAGMEEIWTLPPEAMEKTEILAEQDASRLGFPPTQRVVNFITKKHFRALTAMQLAGTTTEGGGETNFAEMNSTRIDGPRRLTINASHLRENAVRQDERAIIPDPDTLFTSGGTVTGADGGSIDPALDRLVGRAVTRAPLPADPGARRALLAYAAGAGQVLPTDIGAFRTLKPRSDTIKTDGTLALPIGQAVSSSITLGMEAKRSDGLNGLAPAVLRVPGGGALPFADDTLVYRYFPGSVLRQRDTSLNLHAGGTLQGVVKRWAWTVTNSYDRTEAAARSEQGIPTDALQAAVRAGADPLTAPDPADAAARIVVRRRTVTDQLSTVATANGPVARLPAGEALVTVTADYNRSNAGNAGGNASPTAAAALAMVDVSRTVRSASVNATVPLTSSSDDVLPFLGTLSLDGTLGVSDVSDFGRLFRSRYALTWSVHPRIQLTASIDESRDAPAIALLSSPIVRVPNVPFFDFTTGSSVTVTTVTGGNPALGPEQRRELRLGVSGKPIKNDNAQIGLDYVETQTRGRTTMIGSVTPALQAAFPELFVRDAAGRLVSVDMRSVNTARERDRQLRLSANIFTQIGRAPPKPKVAPGSDGKTAPPPPPPKDRPSIYAFVTATYRLENDVLLRDGLPVLDLLDGATLNGTGGRPRWEGNVSIGGRVKAVNMGVYARFNGPSRVRSTLAASDLRFSGLSWLTLYGSLNVERAVKQPWTKNMTINVTLENALNARTDVRDRDGATPNRFQRAYLDPLGRSFRLGVRKLF